MSEETKNNLPSAGNETEKSVATKDTEKEDSSRRFSRREALLGALFGAGVAVAKAAEAAESACACLAPPDCSTICPNGGSPKGDGTQACDCNPEGLATVAYTGKYSDLIDEPTLATVAKTGSYNDLKDKPASTTLPDLTSSGSAGPTADVTMKRVYTYTTIKTTHGSSYTTTDYDYSLTSHPTGSFQVPYFTVDSKGRITSYGSRTITIQNTNESKYATKYDNYGNYGDYSDCGDMN